MSADTNSSTPTGSLGELLRKSRSAKGLELEAVAKETRISPKILIAMEEGDYAALPANAFTRGFYNLYAQALELDPEEILKLYSQETINHPNLSSNKRILPGNGNGEVLEFAERPRSLHFSSIGFLLILLFLFGAFLCWYFSWNPATFLSQKLRSYQQNPQQVEDTLESQYQHEEQKELFSIVKVSYGKDSPPKHFKLNNTRDIEPTSQKKSKE